MQSVCKLCPRNCGVSRESHKVGYCKVSNQIKVARASLHMWEEPCISGKEGSGTIFFSGCNMGCVYCQNYEISKGTIESNASIGNKVPLGKEISVERLAELFLELQEKGANNINLVTPTHYLYQIKEAILLAKEQGLKLPVVYNTSAYEKVEALRELDGLIDIYLPDFKYMTEEWAVKYSNASAYPDYAKAAIEEMVRQVGAPVFTTEGKMVRGVIVRHLVLPGLKKEAKAILQYLHKRYGNQIYISIMNQYTPMREFEEFPNLNRRVTKREYENVLDYAIELGVEQAFFQEGDTAKESFIPDFNGEGV